MAGAAWRCGRLVAPGLAFVAGQAPRPGGQLPHRSRRPRGRLHRQHPDRPAAGPDGDAPADGQQIRDDIARLARRFPGRCFLCAAPVYDGRDQLPDRPAGRSGTRRRHRHGRGRRRAGASGDAAALGRCADLPARGLHHRRHRRTPPDQRHVPPEVRLRSGAAFPSLSGPDPPHGRDRRTMRLPA